MLNELLYALRRLKRTPIFTCTVVLCLGLGLAVLMVTAAVTDAFLLRPLPFAEPDRLLGIWKVFDDEASAGLQYFLKPTDFRFLREEARQVRVAVVKPVAVDVTGTGEPEQLSGGWSTAALAPVLGIEPLAGRWFDEEEERTEARVAVIGESLWQSRWGSSRKALGATLSLDGAPYTVIGVMPRGLGYPDGVELWMPMRHVDWQGNQGVLVVGRLAAGAHRPAAREEVRALGKRLVNLDVSSANAGLEAARLQDSLVEDLRPPLIGLAASAASFLLIAMANAMSLVVARAIRGRGEASVRHALGASHLVIARQVAWEVALVTAAAVALGLVAARSMLPWLVAASPVETLSFAPAMIDGRIAIGVLALATVIVLVLTAAGTAMQTGTSAPRTAASSEGRAPRHRRFLAGLAVADVAVTAMMLVASWHAAVSVRRMSDEPPGIHAEGVLTAGVSAPSSWAETFPRRTAFQDRVLEEVASIPGVESVGAGHNLPMTTPEYYWAFRLEDRPEDDPEGGGLTLFRVITPGYVETMGMSVLAGRDVARSDTAQTRRVVLVNQAFAERRWSGLDPIGQRLLSRRGNPLEVVGVVSNVRERGLARPEEPCVYWPAAQYDRRYLSRMSLVLSSNLPAAPLAAALREKLRRVDAEAVLFNVRPMSEVVAASMRRQRFTMLLLSIFAVLAVAQAAAGVYGLASYDVVSRSRELGVRRALGARRWQLRRMIVGDGLRHAAFGLTFGGLAAVWVNQWVEAVWDFGAAGPATYLCVGLLLLAVVAGAAWPAAGRAARADPVIALRAT